ncbi:MAG: hypothetical protein O3B41_06830 [Bacteroidetes bacterium]|nr:hypothetical protein [Bacteroidota bacterium]
MDWDISGSTAGISKVGNGHFGRARFSFIITCFALGLSLFTFTGCDSSLFGGASSETEKALSIFDASAVVVAHLDVQKGFESLEDLMGDKSAESDMDAAMEQLATYLGINPREDVHHMYVSFSSLDSTGVGSLIAFVDFNQAEMVSKIESISELTRIESAGKADSYRFTADEDVHFSLVDGSMILISNNSGQLERLVSRANGPESSGITDDLLLQVEKRESWVIVRNINELLPAMDSLKVEGQMAQIISTVKAIQSIGIGANTTGREIEGVLLIEPSAEVSAKDLANVFSGLRAAARLGLADAPELVEQIEEIDITTVEGLVKISLDVEEDAIKELMQSMGAHLKEMVSDRGSKKEAT